MRLFKTLLLVGAAQASDFEVIRCNNLSTNATEMTISVDGDYMTTHHDALKGTFTFDGTDYTKVIDGSALTMDLTDSTYIYLDYEMVTAQTAVANSDIHFAGRTTGFRCKYPRAVSVGDSYTVEDVADPSPYISTGFLQYDFTVSVANGRTTAIIAPQHGLSSLEANVENCTVSYANLPNDMIYPVRQMGSWADSDVCIDNRIDTTFTYANGGATVDWRTFHFNAQQASSQTQSVDCIIHASNTLSVSAPSNCNCYDEQTCLRTNGVCHDRIWHGEQADLQSSAYPPYSYSGFPVSNIFDNNMDSYWAEHHVYNQIDGKTFRMEFQNPIDFDRLVIHTRSNCNGNCMNRYNNVCLVLDDNVSQELCTDSNYGWASISTNSHQPTITWSQPTQSVRIVSLIFRGPLTGDPTLNDGLATFNDLKIHHTECGLE